MVLDIVETNDNMEAYKFDCIAPTYSYIVRESIRYLSGRIGGKDCTQLQAANERLRLALDQFNRRWDLNPSQPA